MEKKESVWERDITHDIVGVLAVFGLVVSSVVLGTGVATLGVQAQVAFAEHDATATQTAAVLASDAARPTSHAIESESGRPALFNASSTPASALRSIASSTRALYCPSLASTVARGDKDATSTGSVRELQRFIASHYGLEASSTITGYFGSTTAAYLAKFQEEQGIAPAPRAGGLTRAAIAKLCSSEKDDSRRPPGIGTSTPQMRSHDEMMGTSTRPAEPPKPVSMQTYEGASNAAAVVSALGEISSGVGHLIAASLSLVGL